MNPLYKTMCNDLIIKKLAECSEIFKNMQNHYIGRVKTQGIKFDYFVFRIVQILKIKPLC